MVQPGQADPAEPFVSWEAWQRLARVIPKGTRNWSVQRSYELIVELVRTAQRLREEAGAAMPVRSSVYDMSDRRDAQGEPFVPGSVDFAAGHLGKLMNWLRDRGAIPWNLFSDDSVGEARRGRLPRELDEYVRRVREHNVPPVLVQGRLVAVLVEKAGLVAYLREAVQHQLPVGSSEGNIRKGWAHGWLEDLHGLADRMHAHGLRLVYLGDGEAGLNQGWTIRDNWQAWLRQQYKDVTFDHFAVTEAQVERLGREIHVDGFIALRGQRRFARDLREHIGLPEAT
jgi:hypothetical protein